MQITKKKIRCFYFLTSYKTDFKKKLEDDHPQKVDGTTRYNNLQTSTQVVTWPQDVFQTMSVLIWGSDITTVGDCHRLLSIMNSSSRQRNKA